MSRASTSHKFIPQSDDEEQLYSITRIVKERTHQYLVEWEGVDENGKPWENTWVPKCDVTEDAKKQWREEERKRKLANAARRKSRASVGSEASSRIGTRRLGGISKGKEKASALESSEGDEEQEERPRKRMRMLKKQSSVTLKTKSRAEPEAEEEDADDESIAALFERPDSPSLEKAKGKGKAIARQEEDEVEEEVLGIRASPSPEPAVRNPPPLSKVGPPRGKRKRQQKHDSPSTNSRRTATSSTAAELAPPRPRSKQKLVSPDPEPSGSKTTSISYSPPAADIAYLRTPTRSPSPVQPGYEPPTFEEDEYDAPEGPQPERGPSAVDPVPPLPQSSIHTAQTFTSTPPRSQPTNIQRVPSTPSVVSKMKRKAGPSPRTSKSPVISKRDLPPDPRREVRVGPPKKFRSLPRASPAVFRDLRAQQRLKEQEQQQPEVQTPNDTQETIEEFSSPERIERFKRGRRRVSDTLVVPPTQDVDSSIPEDVMVRQMEDAYLDLDPPRKAHESTQQEPSNVPFPSTASTQQAVVDSQSQPSLHVSQEQANSQLLQSLQEKDALIAELEAAERTHQKALQEKDARIAELAHLDRFHQETLQEKEVHIARLEAASHSHGQAHNQHKQRILELEQVNRTHQQALQASISQVRELEARRDVWRLLLLKLHDQRRGLQAAQASVQARSEQAERHVEELEAALEGTRTDGIVMMKAMFMGRVKQLESEAHQWKSLYHLREMKDAKTDDEMRKRAAMEPELRAENARLERDLENMEGGLKQAQEEICQLKLELAGQWHVCQYVENGVHCHARFLDNQGVRDHAYDVHYPRLKPFQDS